MYGYAQSCVTPQEFVTLCKNLFNMDEKPIRNSNDLVSAAIGIIGWICLLVGISDFFAKDSSWQEGLVCIVGAMFLFGFSIIVKAACKYLDK